ncbi:MAG: hypothetical protein IH840_00305, partial [Candidatus Heimdallarchaeota archaeon]|nr:hypothetical protein [Candidatus Heimdallarchaeota archaeon]
MTWTSVQPFASRNKTGLIVLLVVCSLIIGTISGPWVVEEPRDISDSEIAGNHSKRSVDDLSTKVNFDQSPDDLAIFFTDSELYHDFIETQKVVSHYDSLMAARIRFIKPLPEIFDVEGIKIVSSAVYNQAIPLHSTYQSSAPSESFDASIRLKQDSSSDLSQLSLLNIAPVHSLGYFGEGIRIGLVDNGVDFN